MTSGNQFAQEIRKSQDKALEELRQKQEDRRLESLGLKPEKKDDKKK